MQREEYNVNRRHEYIGLSFFVLALTLGGLGFLAVGGRSPALAGVPATSLSPTDGTEPLPPGASIQTVLSNMTKPIAMAFDPQGRLFYTEKEAGNVRLFSNGSLQASPVIHYAVDGTCSERGLLGIAIDPNFTTNHYIYVYYTYDANPGTTCEATTNRVARFVENNGVGTNSVDIFTSTQTAGNHNGGNIHFGPDGKLYISIGDNANAANSQDVTVKNGKIHRINSDGTIPPDNPVFTQTGALGSLYAMGVRNTFDFTFDSLTSGRIFASENGPGCDDEMNRIEAGYNYGWRASYPCDDTNPSSQYNTIAPLWFLANGTCCMAPTGITVYTGSQIPQWRNGLFMATYNNSQLRHFYLNADRTLVTTTNVVQGVTIGTDLETGPDGALWYIEGGGYVAGTLKKIVGPGGSPTPAVTNTPTPTSTRVATFTPTLTPTPQCPPRADNVAIRNFAFAPQNLTINVGTTIRWTNFDLDYHTATSSDGLWDSGHIQQYQSYSFIFNTPGTYSYFCKPHPYMTGTITVVAGCSPPALVGHVIWQGRPAQPDWRQSLPITVTLRSSNTGTYFDYGTTTDQDGFFTLTVGLPSSGDYTWRVKGPQYLATTGNVTLTNSDVQLEMGTQSVGDADNNNCVGSSDFNVLKVTFGKSVGDPGYDARADFNGDNAVNVGDFTPLKANFGQCGANPIHPYGK